MKKIVVSLCSLLFASSLVVSASAAQPAASCVSTPLAPSAACMAAFAPSCASLRMTPACMNSILLCAKQNLCQNGTCPTKTFKTTASTAPIKPTAPSKVTAPTKVTAPSKATAPTKVTAPSKVTAPTKVTTPSKATTPTTTTPPTNPTTTTPPVSTASASSLSAYEQEVVRLVNEVRAQNGLKALTANSELSKVARLKSQNMKDKNYFSHTSPTYGSPFDMMRSFGISYRAAGENIAYGQQSPQEVMNAWMNSSGHRANILNASFTQIGVGYVSDGNYWTQMFIG